MGISIEDTMLDSNECWVLYAEGCALFVGNVNEAVALDC
jgi:hypothetical protein